MRKLFVVQHGLFDRHSHFYGETLGWSEVCRARGIPLHLYIGSHAGPELVAEFSANPCFPYPPAFVIEQDPVCTRLADFIALSAQFAEACAILERDGIGAGDVMLVPYATDSEVLGAALWLEHVPAPRRPSVVFIFYIPDLAWAVETDRRKVTGNFSFHRYAMKRLRAVMPAEKVSVFATSALLATALQRIFQHPCEKCPQPTHYLGAEILAKPDERTGPRVNVRLAGEFRLEKGDDLAVKTILQVARLRPGTSFAVQIYALDAAEEVAAELAPLAVTSSKCYLQTGQLDHELYQRRLLQSDILLLPYRWPRYALRSSGVFSEAAGFGIVTVVPNHTWMADMLNEGWGAGTVFNEPAVDDIAAALIAAMDAYAALSAKAQRTRSDWRRANCTAALLDQIVRRTNG